MSDPRTVRHADSATAASPSFEASRGRPSTEAPSAESIRARPATAAPPVESSRGRPATAAPSIESPHGRLPAPAPSDDTRLAVEIRELIARGQTEEARERFGGLVAAHQRRALRIAYQYLRDAAEADEAVQDAFVKVFSHFDSYRDAWPFEVWFTRILINGCLDRRKARARRDRWFSRNEATGTDEARYASSKAHDADPETRLLARERRARLAAAIGRLDGRQRTVFTLCHFGDRTPREVSAITGLNESTVRVHLFRAARKLRGLLGGKS